MASLFATVSKEENISKREAVVVKNTKLATKYGNNLFVRTFSVVIKAKEGCPLIDLFWAGLLESRLTLVHDLKLIEVKNGR